MQRSFGQFQKRLAATETDERLTNVRERLADIKRMWDEPQVSIEDVAQYFRIEDRRRSIRIKLRRLRREAGSQRSGRRGRTRAMSHSQSASIAFRAIVKASWLVSVMGRYRRASISFILLISNSTLVRRRAGQSRRPRTRPDRHGLGVERAVAGSPGPAARDIWSGASGIRAGDIACCACSSQCTRDGADHGLLIAHDAPDDDS